MGHSSVLWGRVLQEYRGVGVMWAVLVLVLSPLCMVTTTSHRRPPQDLPAHRPPQDLPAHKRQSVQYSTLVGPSFINASAHAHAHAPIGQTAHLTCIIRNLHNYTVSWVRARDIHLLTAGLTTYTSDNRFVSVNPGGGSRWVLRVHHARASDAGTYLCQVSLSPPISTTTRLLVTQATARVEPGREVFLREGSEVVLVCEVRGCPYPSHPTWYRGPQKQQGTKLYEGTVGDTTPIPSNPTTPTPPTPIPTLHNRRPKLRKPDYAVSERSSTPLPTLDTTTSTPVGLPIARITLTRAGASAAHSGLYTCTSTCTPPLNLSLHVLTGDEEIAAMQHPNGTYSLQHPCLVTVLTVVTSQLWQRVVGPPDSRQQATTAVVLSCVMFLNTKQLISV